MKLGQEYVLRRDEWRQTFRQPRAGNKHCPVKFLPADRKRSCGEQVEFKRNGHVNYMERTSEPERIRSLLAVCIKGFRQVVYKPSEAFLAEIRQNIHTVGEARLAECRTGLRTADRITNPRILQRGAQRMKGVLHAARAFLPYTLSANSKPNRVTAMR